MRPGAMSGMSSDTAAPAESLVLDPIAVALGAHSLGAADYVRPDCGLTQSLARPL